MPRKHNIRWTANDFTNLRKAVTNFNAKIRRIEKAYPELKSALPEKITFKEMKEIIKTRNDLNRELDSLRRFTDRKNQIKVVKDEEGKKTYKGITVLPNTENNIKTTIWQNKEMDRRLRYINKRREKRRKEIAAVDVTSRGKKVGYKIGELGMGHVSEHETAPLKKSSEKMTQKDMREKMDTIRRESSDLYWESKEEILMKNYLKALSTNLTDEEREAIEAAIKELSFEEFYKIFLAENKAFIKDLYFMSEDDRQAYVNDLMKIWVTGDPEGAIVREAPTTSNVKTMSEMNNKFFAKRSKDVYDMVTDFKPKG